MAAICPSERRKLSTSLAVTLKLGAVSPPSWTKRTSPAATWAEVKLVALLHVPPTFVWKAPWLTAETVKVNALLSGSLTVRVEALSTAVPPSPIVKPALAAQFILWFMAVWNDYLAPIIYLNSPERQTLQLVIGNFNAQYAIQTDYPLIMAASFIYFWPIWVIGGWGVGLALHAWDTFLRKPVTEADVDAELTRQRRS